ncbi:ABC transporter permease [Rhizobium binxianense]
MIKMIARRIVQLIPTLLILSVIIFILQRLLPGDPALALAGEESADPQVLQQIREQYGLDKPLPVQYLHWIGSVLTGDLGQSMRMHTPVYDLILQRLPVTLQISIMAMVLALVIGIGAGIISAVKKDSGWDYSANVVALVGISVPHFWLGIMMILFFSVKLGWFPASGYVSPFEDFGASLRSTAMPAIVLGSGIAGIIMRHTRSAMLQALTSDYVRTARAKGLFETVVISRHAMRNALTPIITLGALEFGGLLGGAVLTEQIFNIPGFGKLIVDAVYNRDYAVVQGVVLVTAAVYVLMSLLADIGYVLSNPRLRD